MTKWLSHRMVERGIIKEEEQELYQFGIRNGMILLLNVVTALVIGLLTEQLAVVAVFTLSFMVLRSYTVDVLYPIFSATCFWDLPNSNRLILTGDILA